MWIQCASNQTYAACVGHDILSFWWKCDVFVSCIWIQSTNSRGVCTTVVREAMFLRKRRLQHHHEAILMELIIWCELLTRFKLRDHESWCLKDNQPRLCPRWCNTCPILLCEFGARLMIEALNWNIWSTSGLPYRPLKLRYFQYVCGRFPIQELNQRLPKELNMKWPVLQTWLIGWHILLEKRPGSNTFHLQLKNKVGKY